MHVGVKPATRRLQLAARGQRPLPGPGRGRVGCSGLPRPCRPSAQTGGPRRPWGSPGIVPSTPPPPDRSSGKTRLLAPPAIPLHGILASLSRVTDSRPSSLASGPKAATQTPKDQIKMEKRKGSKIFPFQTEEQMGLWHFRGFKLTLCTTPGVGEAGGSPR